MSASNVSCFQCGATEWLQTSRSVSEKLREWFSTGVPPWSSFGQCASCGHGFGCALLRPAPLPAWYGAPVRVMDVLRHSRSMHPVPITYLWAAGIALVAGVVLDSTLGIPWWTAVVAGIGGVWLCSLASAFGRSAKPGLGLELLGAHLDRLFVTSIALDLGENLPRAPEAGWLLALDVGVAGRPEPRLRL